MLEFLKENAINIKDCRGQSHDNAANMSGKYKGMKSHILIENDLALFVPCCGHSLNLVGKAAANSTVAAVKYFELVQSIYVFFTASTERYNLLLDNLSKNEKFLVPKSLSETRWSCRADAVKAIVLGYNSIKTILGKICDDCEQKSLVKVEAEGLFNKLCSLEVAFFLYFGMTYEKDSILQTDLCKIQK